jgi:hypothetical protein
MAVVLPADGAASLARSEPLAELAKLRHYELLLDGFDHRFALGEGQADIAWNWVRSISVQPHQLHSAHRSCIATVEFKNNRASHSTARSRDPRRKDSSKYAGVPPFLTASLLAQLVDLASSNKGLQHPLGAARD